jgi:hypothetical protein
MHDDDDTGDSLEKVRNLPATETDTTCIIQVLVPIFDYGPDVAKEGTCLQWQDSFQSVLHIGSILHLGFCKNGPS